MAKQTGLLRLTGTVGGMTFRQTADGEIASSKSTLDKKRVMKDPAFERSRVAGRAFKLAGEYAGLLKRTFRQVVDHNSDARLAGRLTGAFVRILKQDYDGYADGRRLKPELVPQLRGFECNKHQSVSAVIPLTVEVEGNRQMGEWEMTIHAIETAAIKAPAGAKYFRVSIAVAAVNFQELKGYAQVQETGWLPLVSHTEPQKQFSFHIADAGTSPVITVAAVSFAGEASGTYYPLYNKMYNAAVIVQVDA